MEGLEMNTEFWRGKRVFMTGHTGFKGGWLSLWLHSLGAEVHGYALPAPTSPNLFSIAGIPSIMATSTLHDIGDGNALKRMMLSAAPDVVFHLAAQSLVRASYQQPVDTFRTNVMGTVNLLEAVRQVNSVRAVVNVTTDKCYLNREWFWGYREDEPLGGHDPYSASKACSELVTAAYRASFLHASAAAIATARAGNVIGGGDWAADRLIPDLLRAGDAGEELAIRSPQATRPWQHVLEPLSGYLLLAKCLFEQGDLFADAWNFGPSDSDAKTVQWIVDYIESVSPSFKWRYDQLEQAHEAHALRLDSSKARLILNWHPCWNLQQALDRTLAWHSAWRSGSDMHAFSLSQIEEYVRTVREKAHGTV